MKPNERSNVFRLFPIHDQPWITSTNVAFHLYNGSFFMGRSHTVIGQGAERDQCQRLDKHCQREGIHCEAGGVDLEPQDPDHTLFIPIVVRRMGSPARHMAGLEGAMLSRKLLEGQWQEGSHSTNRKHFSRDTIGVPAKDLAVRRWRGVVADIARRPFGALSGGRWR